MFYNLHSHKIANNPNQIVLYNQYPQELNLGISCFSIGIHPWYIQQNNVEKEMAIIHSVLNNPNCKAIGECGLDKRIEVPFTLQVAVFKEQLKMAQQNQKPVIIHCVGAFQEVISIKKEMQLTVPMVIHGFSKNEQLAKQLVEAGFYLSFGKYLLRNPELATVFEKIPNNRFFLETDTIEETIEDVYDKASYIKKISLQELKNIIEENFNRFFNQ